jgi:hypothetical protein
MNDNVALIRAAGVASEVPGELCWGFKDSRGQGFECLFSYINSWNP